VQDQRDWVSEACFSEWTYMLSAGWSSVRGGRCSLVGNSPRSRKSGNDTASINYDSQLIHNYIECGEVVVGGGARVRLYFGHTPCHAMQKWVSKISEFVLG
jgi:hypothetical protein